MSLNQKRLLKKFLESRLIGLANVSSWGRLQDRRAVLQRTTTDDDRRPRPLLVWPLHYV